MPRHARSTTPARPAETAATPEEILELRIGAPAHGGHCVARHEGRVVFVRHAAPGELVRARVTDKRSKLWHADAVEILEPSPDRVEHVWAQAGPGGVGGAELGHLSLPTQRRWKAAVLADTLRRIGDAEILDAVRAAPGGAASLEEIRAMPGDDAADGLGTRTRIDLTVDDDRRAGMFEYRSHDVRALRTMPLADPRVADLGLFGDPRWRRHWRPGSRVEVVAPSVGDPLVLVDGAGTNRSGAVARKAVRETIARSALEGPTLAGDGAPVPAGVLDAALAGADALNYRVAADGFWQVHREAPAALVREVLAAAARLGIEPGDRVLELYSGAGLFTLPLAGVVGKDGAVGSVEQSARAVADARRNLHDAPWVNLYEGTVTADGVTDAAADLGGADLVVLDPPRTGAGAAVLDAIASVRGRDGGAPRGLVLVSCDPAALARDLLDARKAGYDVASLTALDLFPHTHHFEAVTALTRR